MRSMMAVTAPGVFEPSRASERLRFTPIETSARDVDFGVDAGPLDLPHLDDMEFAELERAVLTHQVVVVRGQQRLSPRDQYELTRRFEPRVEAYGHGNRPEIM